MTKQIKQLVPTWAANAEQLSKDISGLYPVLLGGLDSTVLTHVFCRILKLQNIFSVSLTHVNFMLRT